MKFLAAIGTLAILVAIAAPIYLFGGFFNLSGAAPHYPIVFWAIEHVRNASISRYATDKPIVQLDDPAVIQAGAKAFSERGCVSCHGAPGATWLKFSEALRPDPPDLSEVAKTLSAPEIFWVAKNGIKFTGMPAFSLIGVEDKELWEIAAFVKKLPTISEADYKAWTAK